MVCDCSEINRSKQCSACSRKLTRLIKREELRNISCEIVSPEESLAGVRPMMCISESQDEIYRRCHMAAQAFGAVGRAAVCAATEEMLEVSGSARRRVVITNNGSPYV